MEASLLKATLLTLILLLISFLSSAEAAGCSRSERDVLLETRNMLNPNDTYYNNWDPKTTPDCCQWSGIACNSKGQITSFDVTLFPLALAVQIPTTIQNLRFLQSLSLYGNLSGPIPSYIANLTNLQTLSLTFGLTGPIPAFLVQLNRLTYLNLGLNSLTGSIPSTLGQLTSLTSLFLGDNKLSGSIPGNLGRLVELEDLDLSNNRLSGPIPASLSHLTKANWVYLGGNRLSGSIPTSFDQFKNPEMQMLLGKNRLSGPLPKSLGHVNWTLLDVSMNHFIGDASFLFGRHKTALQSIYLNNNRFKFDFSNVDLPMNIKDLNIHHNQIFGSLPKSLAHLPLEFFNVSENRLCGMIPVGGQLQSMSPDTFANNKCLCGPPLPPCKKL